MLAACAGVDCVVVRRWAFSIFVAETLTAKRDSIVVCKLGVCAARRRQRSVIPGKCGAERLVLSPDGVHFLVPDVRACCSEIVDDVTD